MLISMKLIAIETDVYDVMLWNSPGKKLFAILMLLWALPAKFFGALCEHKLINLYSENWSEVALTIVPLGLK